MQLKGKSELRNFNDLAENIFMQAVTTMAGS